jgi:predicted ester cyclase
MSVSENKANYRRAIEEIMNNKNIKVIPELISPEYVYRNPFGEDIKGIEGFRQEVSRRLNAFPDLHITIDDIFGEGDKLAVLLTSRGTFKGKLGNLEPTGKKLNYTTAYFYKFVEGKQVEARPFMDMLSFYKQLGVSPPKY